MDRLGGLGRHQKPGLKRASAIVGQIGLGKGSKGDHVGGGSRPAATRKGKNEGFNENRYPPGNLSPGSRRGCAFLISALRFAAHLRKRDDLMQGDDSFTKVTHKSWLGRFGSTIAGAFVGLILFIASFVLLYWNEGRAVDAIIALDAVSKQVVSVSAEVVDPSNEGRLIHLSGLVDVASNLVDPAFHVTAPNAIRLERRVEMFQWRENKETKTEKKMGGGETETTTYNYVKEWSDELIDSSSFERQQGHANPAMPYQSKIFDVKSARLGGFTLDQSQITQLSNFEPLSVEAEDGKLPRGFRQEGEYLYRGKAPDQPQIGDLRVTFHNVPVQTISVIAQQRGSTLAGFKGERERTINMVSYGTLDA
ncbi:MAG: TMEM43 family protein [Alphaproteobacteria bacterium]|nr:TMEM43 family protein [Alphaproteobacteria bacterium]